MGWVWREDEDDRVITSSSDISEFKNPNSRPGDRCSTRKIVKSQCKTEEIETGKFIRKCEKTEEILRDCVGRPTEEVQSNREYTEEDVTDEVVNGSLTHGSSGHHNVFEFPGLQNDLEALERTFFGGLGHFFEAAEEMKNSFYSMVPGLFDGEPSSSPSTRRGVPIEDHGRPEASPKEHKSGNVDLSGLATDV